LIPPQNSTVFYDYDFPTNSRHAYRGARVLVSVKRSKAISNGRFTGIFYTIDLDIVGVSKYVSLISEFLIILLAS